MFIVLWDDVEIPSACPDTQISDWFIIVHYHSFYIYIYTFNPHTRKILRVWLKTHTFRGKPGVLKKHGVFQIQQNKQTMINHERIAFSCVMLQFDVFARCMLLLGSFWW